MTLSDFKIQKRAAENWIYAGLLLVRLIIIFVIFNLDYMSIIKGNLLIYYNTILDIKYLCLKWYRKIIFCSYLYIIFEIVMYK